MTTTTNHESDHKRVVQFPGCITTLLVRSFVRYVVINLLIYDILNISKGV